MSQSYAQGTTVPVEKSQGEILALLITFGIKKKGIVDMDSSTTIVFEFNNIAYKMMVKAPDPAHKMFQRDGRGLALNLNKERQESMLRIDGVGDSLLLVLKAKLVAVKDESLTFEEEFLSYAVAANGQTVGELVVPQLHQGTFTGNMAKALGDGR